MSEQASAAPAASAPIQDAAPQNQNEQVNESESVEAEASEAEDILADPDASKAEKAEAKKMLKSLKIKYNGKEYEEKLPFEIPDDEKSVEYMRKQLQMSKMGQSRAQEKAELEKEVEAFIHQLRTNPRSVLEDPTLGVNFQDIVAQYIDEQIELSKKSPEQLEREKMEKELKSLREEREKEKEESKQRELARLQEQEFERYDMSITKALDGSDLPKSPYVVKKMADYMYEGLKAGYDLGPEDVIELVRQEIQADIQQMFGAMPEEVIEKIIGNDVLGKLRKKRVAVAKAAPLKKAIPDTGKQMKKEEEVEKPKGPKRTYRDFFGT